ncbi:MAG TPA: DUF4157 domain-containing protein [Microbacterium sp.]|nr:DUF4157 domain-containing protein [Microbacterium sp.]
MSTSAAPRTKSTDAAPPRRVSHRHDATERQADRAADVVARGGSVTGWSFAHVPAEASVHREEDEKKLEDKPREQGEAYKEAAGKAVEAATEAELPDGRKVRTVIEENPALAAAAAGALAASGKDVPLPLTSLPGVKNVVPPGLSVGVRAGGLPAIIAGDPIPGGRGAGFSDIGLGVTFGYTEQLPKGSKKPLTAAQKKTAAIAAETQRLRDDPVMRSIEAARLKQQGLGPGAPTTFAPPAESGQVPARLRNPGAQTQGPTRVQFTQSGLPELFSQESVQRALRDHHRREAEERRQADEAKRKLDEQPVQREPASDTRARPAQHFDTSGVDAATRSGGRPLDAGLRHSMEARFGCDFSSVRLHDDPQAARAASGVDAAAFTVGEHIVFGDGRLDPSHPEGRHLLAHELAHVVQQRAGAAPHATGTPARVQRRSWWDSFLVWTGLSEGTWTDAELRGYLAQVMARRTIEGDYDSDNKARALVARWKKDPVTWALGPSQKALLIDEMIEGPTLNDDEDAILDILELSEADDLRWIFSPASVRYESLKSNLHGDQDDRFDTFVASRFLGGAAALRRGQVAVSGPPVPKGAKGAATFAMNMDYLEARIRDEESAAAEMLALIEKSTPKDQRRIFDYLWRNAWPATLREAGQVARSMADTKDEKRKKTLDRRLDRLKKRIRTLNVLLGRFFAEKLPATGADLEATTTALTGKAAEEAKEALLPKEHDPLPEDRAPEEPDDSSDTADADTADAETGDKEAPDEDTSKDAADAKDEARRDAERRRKAKARRTKKLGVKGPYRRAMEKALRTVIADQYKRMVAEAGTRVAHSEIAPIADAAREQTRAVLGRYFDIGEKDLTSDTAKAGGNVHSWYEARGEELTAMARIGPEELRKAAISRIIDHCTSRPTLRAVNAKHGAAPAFTQGDDSVFQGTNLEGRTLVTIARDLTADGPTADGLANPVSIVDKLNATYRNWGGVRRGSQVYVNLFEEGDDEKDRLARWDKLRTLVHEYIHTLRHEDYTTFADSFGSESRERHTLVEAVDELFMGMVWAHMAPHLAEPDVRAKVEGRRFAHLPAVTVPDPHHYESLAEAMQLVRKVGVANVAAAYFLGLVDRIGGPSRPPPAPKPPARGRPARTRSGGGAQAPGGSRRAPRAGKGAR